MAKKEKTETKVVLERTYIVPLRREWLKVAKWRRTEKAVTALKQFVKRHMKSDSIKVGKYLNKELWKHGIRNPPHKIKVDCSKDDKGTVNVELFGAPKEVKKEEVKKDAKAIGKESKEKIGKAMEELKKKTEEAKEKKEKPKEEKKEAPKAEKPKEEKKPTEKPKEEKKEVPKEPAKQ